MIRKRVVIVSIEILIALLHFFTGSNYRGPYPGFVNGYLLDILVPFAFYFLLCLNEFTLLRHWIVKSILVFGVGASVEIAQFFGVPIFGQTFDPVDFIMYGIGVLLAAILDTTVFPRIFEFWTPEAGPCSCNTEVRRL
jgi:glycopeptide antibiotics resistance protein